MVRKELDPTVMNWGTKSINYDKDERARLFVERSGDRYEWKTTKLYSEL